MIIAAHCRLDKEENPSATMFRFIEADGMEGCAFGRRPIPAG